MKKSNNSGVSVKTAIEAKLSGYFGVSAAEADATQLYRAVILSVRDVMTAKKSRFKAKIRENKAKKICYLCMEFLIGRQLKNDLINLGLENEYRAALKEMGSDLDDIYAAEPDPGLGNGGLGRLAACFLDSLTTLGYPAYGFSILYEYGLFRQKIIDGSQAEMPDTWLRDSDVWFNVRTDKVYPVRFGGNIRESWDSGKLDIIHENYDEVQAVAYDLLIPGAGEAVNTLRLWRARSAKAVDLPLFSQGQYLRAMQETTDAEVISKVLYPSDEHDEGKLLRLSQQYFLVSATLQNLIADHLAGYGTLESFPSKVAIHLNDTHPALCIPELMRILMDVYSYSWEAAWGVVGECVSYTNHTVMPEALETWQMELFRLKLPRIFMIIEELNRRLCQDLWRMYPGDWERISHMSLVSGNRIRMANLSVYAAHTVNGVSRLHSEILKTDVFRDYANAMPSKFTNVTNGITHRRWLCMANPALAELLDETIGTEYRLDASKLADFAAYENDASVTERLRTIKNENKHRFAKYIFDRSGVTLDPESLFDVQVKRIHEYKRQLMNVLRIIALYNDILDNPNNDVLPKTFIFGGKAASGYYVAKDIIRLIWALGEKIAHDSRVSGKLRVIMAEEYNVSMAEVLIPASDISEQISLAGKEASGTGCMKFMINGALTVGTLDGANVEMLEAVGRENFYLFGLDAHEADELWRSGYNTAVYLNSNRRLARVIERLSRGFAGQSFDGIVRYLTGRGNVCDPYMCLADFESYCAVSARAFRDYNDTDAWAKMSLRNIASSGYFSSDRSVTEYAKRIWHLQNIKMNGGER